MLTGIRLPSRFGRAAVVVFLLLCITSQPSNAIEGFYAGGAVGGEYADVNYEKSIGLNLPGAVALSTLAADDAQGGISSFKAVLGHRWNLPNRAYFSGEIDAIFRLNNKITGFLPGAQNSQNPDADVFPGNWYFDKNNGIGFNLRLGYSPEGVGFLGEEGSIYVIGGIQRLDVTVETTSRGMLSDGTKIEGRRHENVSATPWLVGGGVEIGNDKSRLDLRVVYTSYDFDYGSGNGLTITDPRVNYEYEVSEWGVYLGYTWSLGFGLGI